MSLGGSELDLSKDLANLSEADKRELQQWANNENQKANIQESALRVPLPPITYHLSSIPHHQSYNPPSRYALSTPPLSPPLLWLW